MLLQLNVHYKTRVAVKFTGIPEVAAAGDGAQGSTPAGEGS